MFFMDCSVCSNERVVIFEKEEISCPVCEEYL